MKEPCIDCPNKVIDEWGYFCDLSCGKRTAWENCMRARIEGISEVVEWIETKSSSHSNGKLYIFVESEWQSKLKGWGIE